MPSLYLQSGDYAAYGLSGSTTSAQVQQASTLVDTFLNRPEGLVWTPDAVGNPCYMAAMVPIMALTAPGSIAPGPIAPTPYVTVPVSGPIAMVGIGDVLILDRANPSLTEAVVVAAITPGVSIGLKAVANSHAGGALLEAGMIIQDQKFMPSGRPVTTLSRTPVARIISGSGRYGYGRRGDGFESSINDFNLLAALNQFGGPPVWEIFAPLSTDFDPNTGDVWIPAGIMLAYYTEVRVRYLAGFPVAALPPQIKLATAHLVTALLDAPNLGAIKSYKAGDTAVERFADTLISGDDRAALQRYSARAFA